MKALYDLGDQIASFNFYPWLVMAKAAGATEIVFDVAHLKARKWSEEVTRRRFETIVRPGPALAGLPHSFGTAGAKRKGTDFADFMTWLRDGHRWQTLQIPFRLPVDAKPVRYTVTLRRTTRAAGRNSNDAAWRDFARSIGAMIIEDYDVTPIGLYERLALYAGADMNFFVTNGPAYLALLAGCPVTILVIDEIAKYMSGLGLPPGTQMPGSAWNQRHVWSRDELPALCRHFTDWLEIKQTHDQEHPRA